MKFVKQHFSIKDLENLSGIKAHTIRIWEKRYNILSPQRTSTNIRTYDYRSLQKILNVAFLNENGYKISRISKLSVEEINTMVKKISASSSEQSRALNAFKMSMLNFDEIIFEQTFRDLQEKKSFREIFHKIFLPLLDEIGILWQTSTIKPIHEHFITDLIKQKIYLHLAALKEKKPPENKKMYVLFLPENEIHDIGILYIYYELIYNGQNAIYLGPSLPINNLKYLLEFYDHLIFISYLTTAPVKVQDFVEEFQREISRNKEMDLLLFGRKLIEKSQLPKNVKTYKSILDFIKSI